MAGYINGTQLQLDEDEHFQRRDWAAQRVAWAVFALVLLAALLGLFGSGPLSTASRTIEGAQVQFERFGRNGRPMTMTFDIESTDAGTVTITISDDYLAAAPVERTEPEASEQSTGNGARQFEFDLAADEGGRIVFHLHPRSVGRAKGWVAINDGGPLPISTFFYP